MLPSPVSPPLLGLRKASLWMGRRKEREAVLPLWPGIAIPWIEISSMKDEMSDQSGQSGPAQARFEMGWNEATKYSVQLLVLMSSVGFENVGLNSATFQ